MATKYRQLFADADRTQALADLLAQQSVQSHAPVQQGRVTPAMGVGHGLVGLGEALLARRAGKKASKQYSGAEDERRKAQVAALSGMANPPNMVERPETQNPYARAQGALEADVDPNVVGAYLKEKSGANASSAFGVVNPSDFEPDSLAKFQQTGNFSDLKPVNKMFGRYNPRDYTPESWAQFQESGDPAVLQRFAERKFETTPGGGIIPLDPISGSQAGPPVLTAQQGTQEAAVRKNAEAEAAAAGTAAVVPADRRLDAQAKEPRLQAAERRLDRVTEASEALGTSGGPIEGRLHSLVGTKVAQELEAANAQLINELTALTRVPGVGSQSDLEQRLAQLALPDVTQHPDVRAKSILELKAFIADLDQAIRRVGGGGGLEQAPAPQQAQGDVTDWGSLK